MNDSHEIASEDPLELFDTWFTQAQESEPNDPNAAALATSTRDGVPSVRMVLAKRIGERCFCFFTNEESRKGKELTQNPRAALCFHWKTLRRQVRAEGEVSELDAWEVDRYFIAAREPDKRSGFGSESYSSQSCGFGRASPHLRPEPSRRNSPAIILARLLPVCGANRILAGRRRPAA